MPDRLFPCVSAYPVGSAQQFEPAMHRFDFLGCRQVLRLSTIQHGTNLLGCLSGKAFQIQEGITFHSLEFSGLLNALAEFKLC